jgi:hypothetical protein
MATGKDVKWVGPDLAEPVIPEMNAPDAAERPPAGRIIHDDRGNALWKWAGDASNTATGSGILKHIDPSDLQVESHSGRFAVPRSVATRAPDPDRGYDPYNQTQPRNNTVVTKKGTAGKR